MHSDVVSHSRILFCFFLFLFFLFLCISSSPFRSPRSPANVCISLRIDNKSEIIILFYWRFKYCQHRTDRSFVRRDLPFSSSLFSGSFLRSALALFRATRAAELQSIASFWNRWDLNMSIKQQVINFWHSCTSHKFHSEWIATQWIVHRSLFLWPVASIARPLHRAEKLNGANRSYGAPKRLIIVFFFCHFSLIYCLNLDSNYPKRSSLQLPNCCLAESRVGRAVPVVKFNYQERVISPSQQQRQRRN